MAGKRNKRGVAVCTPPRVAPRRPQSFPGGLGAGVVSLWVGVSALLPAGWAESPSGPVGTRLWMGSQPAERTQAPGWVSVKV